MENFLESKFSLLLLNWLKKVLKVYPELAFALNYKEKDLSQFPSTTKIFFRNGKPLKEGDLLVQKDLGERYDELQIRKGGFYQGFVSKSITKISQDFGGRYISQKDFDLYNVKYRKPVEGNFRGHKIFSMSPPSSGGVHVVQILNILSHVDLKKLGRALQKPFIIYPLRCKRHSLIGRISWRCRFYNCSSRRSYLAGTCKGDF